MPVKGLLPHLGRSARACPLSYRLDADASQVMAAGQYTISQRTRIHRFKVLSGRTSV